MKIASAIIQLLESGQAFTDVSVRPGYPLYYHGPAGYLPVAPEPLTTRDVDDFCDMLDGNNWRAKLKANGQYDCSTTIRGIVRLRANIFQFGSENKTGVVARKQPLLPMHIDDLGVSFDIKKILSTQPKGLFLVSGPTGSGKSTTLAAIIDHFNATVPVSIVTLEQPIEFDLPQKKAVIIQREIPTNVLSFAKGIESAKRQDPNIIMVGEVRDRETVDAMLVAACSGHLVLATTHARSAPESVESLLSYYSDEEMVQKRSLLATSLIAINSQVLMASADQKKFVLGYELMLNSPTIATSIRDGKLRDVASAIAQNESSLNHRLAKLVAANIVTKEEALAHAYDKDDLTRMLQKPGR